ncbi:MAG: CTP synthase [bacterium]|nr:CTP synthase [bacterium]
MTKFIFISGGVISGLGKGITSASLGLLLESCGFKVTPVKCDMYLNFDAGTMNPLEHGEIFVTDDGTEADQDLGHYERFLGKSMTRESYITAGQIYQEVLRKERCLEFEGKCVEAYIHIPEEIIRRIEELGKKTEIVLVEFGGTVGEYQNIMFFEAARRLKLRHKNDVLFVHVGYLPVPPSIGEMKTKPLQQSIHELNSLGISPDIVICRSEKSIDARRKSKIAFAAALEPEDIFSNPDVPSIYEVPLVLEGQGLALRVLEKLSLKPKKRNLNEWRRMVQKIKNAKKEVKIAIVGKYYSSGDFALEDSYVCVVEAIKHAAWSLNLSPKIIWQDSGKIEKDGIPEELKSVDGIIVPQGWGNRGVEGKITAIKFARENKVPYLGLCFGMQMAVIEFGRNVLGMKGANSEEVNPKTKFPVVHVMPGQAQYLAKKQFGGTIRLGSWPCKLCKKTKLAKIFRQQGSIKERHRHRYEFNNKYRKQYEKAGMIFSGVSPDGQLVEAIEISDHPFFVATQFHPEYKSQPLYPHPIFISFVEASSQKLSR